MFNNVIYANFFTDYGLWILVGVVLIGFMILTSFSNKKRSKQMNDMHTTLRIGDEIMTIGGIVGTIIEIREISPVDKDFVLETGVGDKKATMRFDLRALYENRTRMKEVQAEQAKQAEIARAKKDSSIQPEATEEAQSVEVFEEATPTPKNADKE